MPDSEVSTNSGHMAIISPEDDGKNPACDKWNLYQLCPRRTILCSKLLHHNCRNSLCSNTKYHHLNYWLQRKVEPTSPTRELHWLGGGRLGGRGGQELELPLDMGWSPLETAWITKWERQCGWSTAVSLEEKCKRKIKMEIHRTALWSHTVWINILPCYRQSEFVQLFLYCFVATFLPKNKTTAFISPHVHYINYFNAENKTDITSVYNRLSGSISRAEISRATAKRE